jgi:hypothetical protein
MPLTALGGSAGTVTVGDVSLGLFPQPLHPNVMAYVAAVTANGYSPSRSRVDALNNLVWSLVGEELWDLCDVIYPFLGGTTGAAHKWNLKNVADTDAAYRILWVLPGNITFSEFGVQSNATGGTFGNTYYTPGAPPSPTTISNIHISAYANIGGTATGCYFGATTSGAIGACQIIRTGGGLLGGNPNISNASFMSAGANFTGFFQPVRTGTSTSVFYRNGLNVATSVQGVSTPGITPTVYVLNRGGNASPSNARLAFASLGRGMTAQQSKNFYNIVQAYQTALGRQV